MKLTEILEARDLGYNDLEAIERLKYIVRLFVATFLDTFCFYRKIDTTNIDIEVKQEKKFVVCYVTLPADYKLENMEIINVFPKTILKEVLPDIKVKVAVNKKDLEEI